MAIERVAVLGAGVMGAGIAAHLSNAGLPVLLLDIVPEGAGDRNALAAGAVERMLGADPAPLMHRRNARRVQPGNLEDDLGRLDEADWIVEAVIERLDVKRDLYRRVEAARKPGSIVSSNTSTIPLARLVEGLPETFRRDFLISHFFNPPRYMRLLELVGGEDTRAQALETLRRFGAENLGKGVVECHDTPGFIANRIGIFWLQCAVVEAIRMGIGVEEADALCGRPMGIPRTGVFGLLDLIGIDLMPHVLASLEANLAEDDALREYGGVPPVIERMLERGLTGRKGGGGFYRVRRGPDGERIREALDLESGEYRKAIDPRGPSLDAAREGGLRALVEHPEPGGRFAWRVLSRTLAYAASLVPEIADDVTAVDTALRLGFNWKQGPFELVDAVGAERLAAGLESEGLVVPALLARARSAQGFYRAARGRREFLGVDGGYHRIERAPGVLLLDDVRLGGEPVASNRTARLWDLGDGVLCLEWRSKMNVIEPEVLAMLREAVALVPRAHRALVIHNDSEHFSAGVNLGLALFAANIAAFDRIEALVREGQETYLALKHAPFPVVGAPAGMALGGGCELLLHCDALEAHAETYIGLVEPGVGLIPGWGGCKEMLARWSAAAGRPGGPMPPVNRVFEIVGMATVARSAEEARDLGFLRPGDGITMNRDRVLAAAKRRALDLAGGYRAPDPPELRLPGPSGRAALALAVGALRKAGKATDYDAVVGDALAEVLTGGDTDFTVTLGETALLELERRVFMRLVRDDRTLARMEHMLDTGKPLRN